MVRISGPDAIGVVAKAFCSADGSRVQSFRFPRAVSGHATVALHGDQPHLLPCDAFLWPTARSYTREPVAELHTFGSPPLLDALLATACRAGARLADPGEFTLRAFLAGRIDLTQAEAVLGVIDARCDADLTAALVQLAGGLARPLQKLRDYLLQLLAELEAGLDFIEEDITFVSKETILARLAAASQLLADVAEQLHSRATVTTTTQVALVGPPNAGKSSLFNALVARFGPAGESIENKPIASIVSSQRGTTRDYLTATIDINGARCELVDTAGVDLEYPGREEGTRQPDHDQSALRQSQTVSEIDRAAQSLAAQRRVAAAIRVCCIDATSLSSDAREALPVGPDFTRCELVALTKSDLTHLSGQSSAPLNHAAPVVTSSRTGEGLDALCNRIRALLQTETVAQQSHAVASTAERCGESVRLAEAALARASEIIRHDAGDELAAAELHVALSELGKVVGAVYTDDLLDRIFSTFCIGK
jgi:tRNA modification GTPase